MKRVTNAKTWETALNHLENEMGYSHLWKRLSAIEDILSDENGEYDLDRLEERYVSCITLRDEVAERVKLSRAIPIEQLREIVRDYEEIVKEYEDGRSD